MTILVITQMGFDYYNDPNFTGEITVDAFLRIGDYIADYTVMINFIKDPTKQRINIIDGQRVSAVYSPVPIPGTIWLLGSVFSFFIYKRRKRGH